MITLTKEQAEVVFYILEGALWLSATRQDLDKEDRAIAEEVHRLIDEGVM